jgi:hypothetical protein
MLALQFLHSAACPMAWRAPGVAAERGDLPMLKFLHSIGCCAHSELLVYRAAESGSVEVMAWLVERGVELKAPLLKIAAMHSHLQLCQYLFEQGCQWTAEVTDSVLEFKRLSVLQWALSQSIEITAEQQQQY